jgi:hypothetical protein
MQTAFEFDAMYSQIIKEKDQEINKLKHDLKNLSSEVDEMKEFIGEQRRHKIAEDTLINSLAKVMEDIIKIYPTWHPKQSSEFCGYRANIASEIGFELIENIVNYVSKHRNRQLIYLRNQISAIITEKNYCAGQLPVMIDPKNVGYKISSFKSVAKTTMGNNQLHTLKKWVHQLVSNTIIMGKCPIECDGIKYGNTDTQYQQAEDFRNCSNMCLNKCYVSILTYIDNLTGNHPAEIIQQKMIQPSNYKPTSEVVKSSVSNSHQLTTHTNEITGKNVIVIQGSNSTTFNIN